MNGVDTLLVDRSNLKNGTAAGHDAIGQPQREVAEMISIFKSGWFAASLLAAPTVAEAQTSTRSTDWMSHSSWGWGNMLFGSFMMIVFSGGLIVVAILLAKWLWRGSHDSRHAAPSARSALEILKERYALGEIDKKEFDERRKDLMD